LKELKSGNQIIFLTNCLITKMKKRDYLLSGVLLILIGVLLGLILSLFRSNGWPLDLAEVKVTEVKRSDTPLWDNSDLEKMDARFLFKTIAKNVKPAVVYIETIVPVNNRSFTEPDEGDESNQFWDRFLPPRARTVGSGVIISSDGYILTNNHVIDEAVTDGISVVLDDKKILKARIVGADPSTDLAVLKIDSENLPSLTIGNSDLIEVGEWVLAIGNPFRLRSTVTAGIVSALSRDVDIIDDLMRIESFIQTDAAINRGNSGGALVNTSGELIGINTAIATQSGNYQGYGFAVPSNLALKIARDIIEFGEPKRGMLGVTIESVTNEIADEANLNEIRGVFISGTTDDGAAKVAGIKFADIILEVEGIQVNEVNQLQEKIAMFRPGDTVELKLWRDGSVIQKSVQLKELQRTAEPVELNEREFIEPDDDYFREENEPGDDKGVIEEDFNVGFKLRALATPEDHQKFDLYILEIQRNTPAWNSGLDTGMKILEVDGEEVSDILEFRDLLQDSLIENGFVVLKAEDQNNVTGYFQINQ